MCAFRVTISRRPRQARERHLHTAQHVGRGHDVTCRLALLAVTDGPSCDDVARPLRVTRTTVHPWLRRWLIEGLPGLQRHKPPGRPAKLTKTQRQELAALMGAGPVQAGLAAACWRSPLVQQWMQARGGVFYSVVSRAQLRQPLGLSYQKAALVSEHLHEEKRHAWCPTTWPPIVTQANAQHAWLRLGDEASFPPWGTLSYPWARRGHPPMVNTSGQRTGDTVFGLSESCTGRVWSQGQEGRLTSEASRAVLTRVLEQVTPPMMRMPDGANSHTSAARQRFCARHTARLTVFQWPSDSPDDTPMEKRWKNVNQAGTHLQDFPTVAALTDKVEPALLTFAHTPEEILSLCSLPTALAKAA